MLYNGSNGDGEAETTTAKALRASHAHNTRDQGCMRNMRALDEDQCGSHKTDMSTYLYNEPSLSRTAVSSEEILDVLTSEAVGGGCSRADDDQ